MNSEEIDEAFKKLEESAAFCPICGKSVETTTVKQPRIFWSSETQSKACPDGHGKFSVTGEYDFDLTFTASQEFIEGLMD